MFTWKEKYLKYEIETVINGRLESWKLVLEKKSISSMRLKQTWSSAIGTESGLEKKSISSMRLKHYWGSASACDYTLLKRKVSQVWDWNFKTIQLCCICRLLEKKSISSMRLKPVSIAFRDTNNFLLKRKVSQVWDWNDIIDGMPVKIESIYLKRKVSQVWDWNLCLAATCLTSLCAWKEKYLKYEIETRKYNALPASIRTPWKEKYLKYEIETRDWPRTTSNAVSQKLEKKSISSMRLKHEEMQKQPGEPYNMPLKRKVSQVWDWNKRCWVHR